MFKKEKKSNMLHYVVLSGQSYIQLYWGKVNIYLKLTENAVEKGILVHFHLKDYSVRVIIIFYWHILWGGVKILEHFTISWQFLSFFRNHHAIYRRKIIRSVFHTMNLSSFPSQQFPHGAGDRFLTQFLMKLLRNLILFVDLDECKTDWRLWIDGIYFNTR